MGKIVICGNKKGGVGKSTVTQALANYLDNQGKDVCILDCDDEQPSLENERKIDLMKGKDADDMYYIASMLSEEAAPQLKETYKPHYDYTFVDLPGNLKQAGVIDCYLNSDVIFLLFDITSKDIMSTVEFYKKLKGLNYSGKIFGVPTKINPAYKEWHRWLDYKEPTEEEIEQKISYTHHSEVPFELTESWIKNDKITWVRQANTKDVFRRNELDTTTIKIFEELTEKIG